MALMSRLVGPTEQGKLQGANASVASIAQLIGPGIFTLVLAWAVTDGRAVALSGAPFILAALLLFAASRLAAYLSSDDAKQLQPKEHHERCRRGHDNSTASRNIAVLTAAQSLGASSPPIIIALGGLVGQSLSSDPALTTLPVSLYSLGLAVGTLPAAYVMRRFGRRNGYLLGAVFGLLAGLVAASASSRPRSCSSASAHSSPASTPPMCRATASRRLTRRPAMRCGPRRSPGS